MKVTQQQMMMELTQPNISPDNPDRIMELVTCHADPYTAARDGQLLPEIRRFEDFLSKRANRQFLSLKGKARNIGRKLLRHFTISM